MKTFIDICRPLVLTLFALTGFAASTLAAEVSIPDPGLNAAIRDALQKPIGPLTDQDLLSLTVLSACCRDIRSIEGLEVASNLTVLDLHSNSLTNFVVPGSFTRLSIIDLFQNQLTSFVLPTALSNLTIVDIAANSLAQCSLPNGLTNLDTLFLANNHLTNFTLPAGLSRLTQLDLSSNGLKTLNVPIDMTNVATLLVFANQLTNLNLPANLNQLSSLDLHINSLRSLTLPAGLTRLRSLNLSQNLLASFSLPSNLTGLSFLNLSLNGLTNVSLPSGLTNLTGLVIQGNNNLTDLNLPPGLTALETLDINANLLARVTLPAGMRNLLRLNLEDNQLFSLLLPAGMTNLADLSLRQNHLDSLALPADLTKLAFLDLFGNQLTNLTMPGSLTALTDVDLAINRLQSFTLPSGLTNLTRLDLFENVLTSFTLPGGLTALTNLDLGVNQLTSFTVPADATNLTSLFLSFNQLTNLSLPPGLRNLSLLGLSGNRLRSLDLPSGLTALAFLNLRDNQLTNITLPPDMQQLIGIFVDGNPLATFVLSEPLAATNLAGTVATLQNQGVSVFTYPLAIHLVRPRPSIGAFQFGITGPPGVYTVLGSTDLAAWSVLGTVNNPLGSTNFFDATAGSSPQKFYRALLQSPPANMVFIPPNTFTMGSPTNEQDRSSNEGPQTIVKLTRGFWIGAFEVTQQEYLSVMNTNPSTQTGDLSRPVTSVSWPDATNYCAKLTLRELAAGRIPAGTHFRLPTEAEWECAARAGTSTRFSYGDDPAYTSLASHAWYAANSGLTSHPVGQKLPNPWGLYDMEGNVVEWCLDWFGSLPGGVQTDPTGPVSTLSGRKVVRGGAFDNTQQSSRSATRLLFQASPPLTDTDLGFRVVLVMEPQ
jgi:formylglycine-generating enzyme required for sulfatase activity